MDSFADLLSNFIERSGISDAELARRTQVSRQTVFRWREGLSRGPRHRADVLRLAEVLQISDDEKDTLLLAAGYPPEGSLEQNASSSAIGSSSIQQQSSSPSARSKRGIALSLVTLIFIVAIILVTQTNILGSMLQPQPRKATEGETLILVSQFENYGSELFGFNVAGRLIDAVREQVNSSTSEPVRVEKLPNVIRNEASAQAQGSEIGATLVIWGEYDSGRVIAHASAPHAGLTGAESGKEWFISSSEELSTVINTNLPNEIRWEVLYILGQAYYLTGDSRLAEELFQSAVKQPTEDPSNAGLVYFFLGLIESQKGEPNTDLVITYYSEALSVRPNLASVLNNRALAYLQRKAPGDLERAKLDFEQALELVPTLDAAMHNLAVTLFYIDPYSLDQSIELLKQATEINRDSPSSSHALCWYYSLQGEPQDAMPHCDRAISLNSSGIYSESRAVALAKLDRNEESLVELIHYLDYLQAHNPDSFEVEAPLVRAWMQQLELGSDPFDEETILTILR